MGGIGEGRERGGRGRGERKGERKGSGTLYYIIQ